MNSPYTKHLDATLDHHTSHQMAVPTYASVPAQTQPMVIQAPASGSSGTSGAAIAIVAIVVALIVGAGAFLVGKTNGPSWNELRRYEALAGREGEVRGRDTGWLQGRKQGRTEMEFLAKYEQLRTQAGAFNQGWQQGLSTGNAMGVAKSKYTYANRYGYGNNYGGRGYSRGYSGYGYGGSTSNAVASAQNLANATGQPVDVVIN